MPATAAEFSRRVTDILRSVQPLPDEAKAPILHYHRTVGEISGSLDYMARAISERGRYQSVVDRHFGRLRSMALVNLIETFERFLKEVAAECIDQIADLIVDDRFDVFTRIQGRHLASHFHAGSLGKALCESATWLDCEEINSRFRRILAEPFDRGDFYVFPKANQSPLTEVWRYDVMSLVWQMRHTAVHNVGVITQSDAAKLRALSKTQLEAPRVLVPSKNDLLWLKLFLDQTADDCNKRIGERLALLLTTIHVGAPSLVQPQLTADSIAAIFRMPLHVSTAVGVVPTD